MDRRALARIGLVIVATVLVCLLIPGAAIATSGGKIVAHNGKAAFVRDSGAPASSAAATGRAFIAHGPGKAASFVDDTQASTADGLTAALLVAAAMIVAIVYPGLRRHEATAGTARAQTRAPIGHEHSHAA
jgi:hypothetical protein